MMNQEHNLYKKAALGILPNPEMARKQIMREVKEETRLTKKFSWFVPAIACASAAVVICTAVPTVRAAVENFFRSVGAYMSASSEERPQVEGIIIQDNIEKQLVTAASQEDVSSGVPAEDWRNSVSVEIKELMYDGEGLYMTYVIDGSAVGLSTYDIPGDLSKVDPNNAPLFTTANVILNDGSIVVPKYHSLTNNGGLITVTAEYSARGNYIVEGDGTISGLTGKQTLEFNVQLHDAILDVERINKGESDFVRDEPNGGFIIIPLAFDANNNMTVVGEQTYYINGSPVVFEHVNIKPTDISIDLRIPNSNEYFEAMERNLELFRKNANKEGLSEKEKAEFEKARQVINNSWNTKSELWMYLDFEVYLDGKRLTGEQYEGYDGFMDGLINNADNDAMVGQLVIPFPDQSAKELKLVPINKETGKRYETDAIIIEP